MKIRESIDADIPSIVEVLRNSLGDELPISEEIWLYKHVRNPFGRSIVLLAEDNGIIVGVRAFMKWRWCWGKEEYTAYRAVDTATLPEFRGRGIFKKLTLAAVEKAKKKGDALVFNTPNDQSRPGYLKMGWEQAGKIEVAVKPSFSSLWKFFGKTGKPLIEDNATLNGLEDLCQFWNDSLVRKEKLFTPKSIEYLNWRYKENPLQQYYIYNDSSIFLAAGLKNRKGIKELRISELLFREVVSSSTLVQGIIKEWTVKSGAHVVSFSPRLPTPSGLSFKGKFGPILTVRDLNLNEKERDELFAVDNWSYSLGDLELF